MNTNWTSPKTNIFSAIWALRGALASGDKYVLFKEYNEKCAFPILLKRTKANSDFRDYKSTGATISTRKEIEASNTPEFEKHLRLNYHGCFGTREAMDHYYATGEVSADNFKNIGVSHIVKISDMIDFMERLNHPSDNERIDMFKKQFITLETANENHFYTDFRLKNHKERAVKKFKRKLWVVARYDKAEIPFYIKLLNVLLYPLKYIPRKDVLRMTQYTIYTFRIGGVTNGYSVQIQIPKKFSFK